MREELHATWRISGAVGATFLGLAFVFVIIGVFCLPASVIALLPFVPLTLASSPVHKSR
jgi:hypothetical protein